MRRRLAFVLAAFLAGFALSAQAAERLISESFEITIDVRCKEGVVGCDRVRYAGVNRKTGKSIWLAGEEFHTRCADGVTPCRFLGYVFRSKGPGNDGGGARPHLPHRTAVETMPPI